MIISATKLNLVELNLSDIDFILKDKYVDSENTITGGILYSYLKSAAIFRLAGFKEHANWMLSGKGLKNFTFKDVPDIPDIDFGNIK